MNVFSGSRDTNVGLNPIPTSLELNSRLRMDGIELLAQLPDSCASAAFFDPQYRGVLDKLAYGNEGKSRGKARSALPQMTDEDIVEFIEGIDRALCPRGHLFLWMDKFHLCTGIADWISETDLSIVDLITWSKGRMGMGYRTRRSCEYLMVLQKAPLRAKGVWTRHDIPDVWSEKVKTKKMTHAKPPRLQQALIEAVTAPGDLVLDPAAGTFSVLYACRESGRNFLGCDIDEGRV